MRGRRAAIAAAMSAVAIAIFTVFPAAQASALDPEPIQETYESTEVPAELEALIGHQTPAEIRKILKGKKPYHAYFDTATGTYLAAIEVDGSAATAAISPSGCSLSNARMNQNIGGRGYCWGFTGCGFLATTKTNIYYLAAGNQPTTFWFSGTSGIFVPAGSSVSIPLTTFYSITRCS